MTTGQAKQIEYTVIFEPQADGGFTVSVPALPGCITEADTLEEAKSNIQEAIELYLEDLEAEGEAFPEDIPNQPISEKIVISL